MKVKEWIEELKCYDEDSEVIFNFEDEVKVESWTEDKHGNKTVRISTEVKECFVSGTCGKVEIDLWIAD